MERTKAQYWVVPLFHPAMILLDAPVEESAAAMLDVVAERFPNRARIRIVPIAGDFIEPAPTSTAAESAVAQIRCTI